MLKRIIMEEGLSGRLTKRLERSTLKYFLQTTTYALLGRRMMKMNYSAYASEQQLGLESATKMCLYTVPLHFCLDKPL
jgi:hypothetical protein